MIEAAEQVLLSIDWTVVAVVAATAVVTVLAAKYLAKLAGKQIEQRMDVTSGMLVDKVVFYGIIAFGFAVILQQLDVGISTLLAAGGILGIALGFASQTAFSNMISGIFLVFERPFEVGDLIRIDERFGAVDSIDLLSTKIRMLDNLTWRIPNEKLIKSDIITITRYDIRRIDIATSISYEDDIQTARDTLIRTAEENPMVMGDPEPVTIVNSMGDSGIELILRCWFNKNDYIQLLADLTQEVKVSLEEAGCTIPFPHRTVYLREEEEWQKAHLMEAEQEAPEESFVDSSESS